MAVGYNVCFAENAGHASEEHAAEGHAPAEHATIELATVEHVMAEQDGAEHGGSGHDSGGHGDGGHGVGVTFHNEYSSKYMWRGFNEFDELGTWHQRIDFHLGGGWAIELLSYIPIGDGETDHHDHIKDFLEFKYELVYHNTLNEGESNETQYKVNYIYFDFPNLEGGDPQNADEIGIELSFPNLWEIGGTPLIPTVYVGHYMPKDHGEDSMYASFRLENEVAIGWFPNPVTIYGETGYHDGFDNGAHHSDSEFTHVVFGFSTDIEILGTEVTPFLNYQVSMDGTQDQNSADLWGGVGASVSF